MAAHLISASQPCIYPFVRCGCYPRKDVTQRVTFSLLFAILLTACGSSQDAAPDLPESVSPGWKRTALSTAPASGTTRCWKTQYAGPGTADISVCRYQNGGAFDAVQRTPAAGQTVKFQEGEYLVLIKWNGAPKASLVALIRAVQKSLNSK